MIFNPGAGKIIVSGSYSGDDSAGRQITTGCKLSCIIIHQETLAVRRWIAIPGLTMQETSSSYIEVKTDLRLHATDGFEVDQFNANQVGSTYYYWAIEA